MQEIELQYGKKLSDEDLVSYFWENYKDSQDWFQPIWDDVAEAHKMYAAGDGLTEADKQNLISTWRSPISFPYATGTINTIIGSDIADRKEVKFEPGDVTVHDSLIAESLTRLVRFEMSKSNGHRIQTRALKDKLIGGYGFSECYLDTTRIPLRVPPKSVPYWEMWPDPNALEDNLADAEFWIRERLWKTEEIQARWPGKSHEFEVGGQLSKLSSSHPTATYAGRWTSMRQLAKKNRHSVFEFQYKRYEPRVLWYDPETGERKITTVEDLDARRKEMADDYEAQVAQQQQEVEQMAAQQQAMQMQGGMGGEMMPGMGGMPPGMMGPPLVLPPPPPEPIEEHNFAKEIFYRAFIACDKGQGQSGGIVLQHEEISIGQFTYACDTGLSEERGKDEKVKFFGTMQIIFHAQLYVNKALRVYLEIMERDSKGGHFIEEGALIEGTDPQSFIKELSVPGLSQMVADEGAAKIVQKSKGGMIPQGWENFMRTCVDAIAQLSLVTDYYKGTATQERSNVLVTNLQERSAIGLNPLMDPTTSYRMITGKQIAAIMVRHLPVTDLDKILGEVELEGVTHEKAIDPMTGMPQRDPETGEPILQPIIGEDGNPVTPGVLLKSVDPFEFDVAVDVGQASPSERIAVWQLAQTILMPLQEIPGFPFEEFLKELVKYMPGPPELGKSLEKVLSKRLNEAEALATVQGIINALPNLPIENIQQVAMQAMQMLQGGQEQPQGGGEPQPTM